MRTRWPCLRPLQRVIWLSTVEEIGLVRLVPGPTISLPLNLGRVRSRRFKPLRLSLSRHRSIPPPNGRPTRAADRSSSRKTFVTTLMRPSERPPLFAPKAMSLLCCCLGKRQGSGLLSLDLATCFTLLLFISVSPCHWLTQRVKTL